MLGINWPRAYNNTGGHGAYRVDQSRRPARDAAITIIPNAQGGLFSLDGATEFPLLFTPLTEGAAMPKVDQQIRDTLASIIADGFNMIRIGSPTNRYWTESGSNWGVWKYSETDGTVSNRWLMEEAALVQLDKTIAWGLEMGIECMWIDIEGYEDMILRHSSQRPLGTYQGRGMCWSTERDNIMWDVNSRIFTRTSTISGVRHCDNRRIIWSFDNEQGFSDAYCRTTTNSWGGGGSVRWLAKIINSVTDTYGDNGYWRTELAAKWSAWVAASSYSASVGVNGSGGTWNGCVPDQTVFTALSNGSNDKNAVLDFCGQMDVEHVERVIALADASAGHSDAVIVTGTWSYMTPRAHVGLSAATMARGNLVTDVHRYFPDDTSSGVKTGSVVTRRSIFNSAWSPVVNGLALSDTFLGQRSATTGFMDSEVGQYGPNGWRYEREALAAIMACRFRHPIGIVGWAQQNSTSQLLNDGRGMPNDHADVASQCARLMTRCISPIVRHRFFSPASGVFNVLATRASIETLQHTLGQIGFSTGRLAGAGWISDGSEHGAWADKAVVLSIDEGNSPTSDWSTFPKVSDATMAAGTYLINTATEKIHVRHNHGIQAMSPYVNWFIGEMLASPVFSMALSISNLAAAITRAHLCVRSEGPWPLFEGPWMMFVHGSDYTLGLVNRSAAYADTGGIGESAWLSDSDQRTLYYVSAGSQSWDDGDSTEQRLMMPESFTVALDASGAAAPFASLEQEVFKIGNDGLPVRVATSFGSGITSWGYDATCPVYYGQPIARRNTSARGRRR